MSRNTRNTSARTPAKPMPASLFKATATPSMIRSKKEPIHHCARVIRPRVLSSRCGQFICIATAIRRVLISAELVASGLMRAAASISCPHAPRKRAFLRRQLQDQRTERSRFVVAAINGEGRIPDEGNGIAYNLRAARAGTGTAGETDGPGGNVDSAAEILVGSAIELEGGTDGNIAVAKDHDPG